jgi:hypothetical protein
MSCMDKLGWRYTMQAVDMAHDLQLYSSAATVKGRKLRAARDFTAWALFSWQRYVGLESNTRLELRD